MVFRGERKLKRKFLWRIDKDNFLKLLRKMLGKKRKKDYPEYTRGSDE